MSGRTLRSHSKRARDADRPYSASYVPGVPYCCRHHRILADVYKCIEESKAQSKRLLQREKEKSAKDASLITPTLRRHLDRVASRKRKHPAPKKTALVRLEDRIRTDGERKDKQLEDLRDEIMRQLDEQAAYLDNKLAAMKTEIDAMK